MIKTEHLTKHYGTLTAVEDVSFQVGPGEVLGFLGPNGAGKTTTMRMLAGFVTPTSGKASICGHDVESDPLAAKAALGYLPEGAPSYGEMTVRRFLAFIADLRGLQGARRAARLRHVIDPPRGRHGRVKQPTHTALPCKRTPATTFPWRTPSSSAVRPSATTLPVRCTCVCAMPWSKAAATG